jgi:phage tail tape-measure protein
MSLKCPHCGSQNIHPSSQAKESGSALGGLAGIAYGLSSLFRGARAGAALGCATGPAGITIGGVVGAVVSAVLSGTAGYAVGGIFGNQLDKRLLRNHGCDDCGGVFKVEQVAVPQ